MAAPTLQGDAGQGPTSRDPVPPQAELGGHLAEIASGTGRAVGGRTRMYLSRSCMAG